MGFKRGLKLTAEDKQWAKEVKERDGFQCVVCKELFGITNNERLNSHHIIPRELHATKYDLTNGITLCPNHHMFSRDISAHNNPLAFFKFLIEKRPAQLNYLMEKCNL